MRIMQSLFALICLVAGASHASVRAMGFGETPDMAITGALAEAVRQVNGTPVTLDPDFRRNLHTLTITESERTTVIEGRHTSVPEPMAPTRGGLSGYTVESVEKVAPDTWQAVVLADVIQYKPVQDARADLPSLVVGAFSMSGPAVIVDTLVPAARIIPDLQDEMTLRFTRAGSFRVLDRTNLETVAQEQSISQASLDPAEQAKQARLLGADLVVVGHVQSLELYNGRGAGYDTPVHGDDAEIVVTYRVIETATGEILTAGRYTHTLDRAVHNQYYRRVKQSRATEPAEYARAYYPEVAGRIAEDVVTSIYPERVVSLVPEVKVEPVAYPVPRSTPGSSEAPLNWGF